MLIEKLDDQTFIVIKINLTKNIFTKKYVNVQFDEQNYHVRTSINMTTNAKWACHVIFDNLVLIKLLQYKRLCECINTIVSVLLQKYTRTPFTFIMQTWMRKLCLLMMVKSFGRVSQRTLNIDLDPRIHHGIHN
jgi:hypothetical protein